MAKKRLWVLFPLSGISFHSLPCFPMEINRFPAAVIGTKFPLDVFWSSSHVLGEGRTILPQKTPKL